MAAEHKPRGTNPVIMGGVLWYARSAGKEGSVSRRQNMIQTGT